MVEIGKASPPHISTTATVNVANDLRQFGGDGGDISYPRRLNNDFWA
jgi:hypothetical protein